MEIGEALREDFGLEGGLSVKSVADAEGVGELELHLGEVGLEVGDD